MRKNLLHALIISLVFLSMPVLHSAEEEKDRLLVIPLKALSGIRKDEAILLSDLLSIELHNSGRFTILNRDDMKAVLDEKEFELAMGCDDNVCLLENVSKLAVNKIVAGNIGKLGRKYFISIRMINEDGENEVMASENCECKIDGLDKTIEQISRKFLRHLTGEKIDVPKSLTNHEEPPYDNVSSVKLRLSYRDLSVSKVQSMPNIIISEKRDGGFVCYGTINHNYNMMTIDGESVVTDSATGLMWQQSDSELWSKLWAITYYGNYSWKGAKDLVWTVNSKGYAGYKDWRLPTLEEAASLLNPSKTNGRHIDPIFSDKQYCIWTGDECGPKNAWLVDFMNGMIYWKGVGSFEGMGSVRLVRSVNKHPSITTHNEADYKEASTKMPLVSFRTSYRAFDNMYIRSIINKYNFFDSSWNKSGEFQNDYDLKLINDNRVVIDSTTGLMWHQSGSKKDMYYKKIGKWLKKLNKKGYFGYHDWRLPTVEEAASLLESSKKNSLYIDPVFSSKQHWVWTGDSDKVSWSGTDRLAWGVDFLSGSVDYRYYSDKGFLRPVRSMQ